MEELLNNFNDLLAQYKQYRAFINKAAAQAEKFSAEIVQKVIRDHTAKSTAIAEQILPLVPEIESRISDIDAEKKSIEDQKSSSDVQMQELELRHIIGEMTEEEFNNASADLRTELDEANLRLESLDSDREVLDGTLQDWADLAAEAGQSSGIASRAAAEQAAAAQAAAAQAAAAQAAAEAAAAQAAAAQAAAAQAAAEQAAADQAAADQAAAEQAAAELAAAELAAAELAAAEAAAQAAAEQAALLASQDEEFDVVLDDVDVMEPSSVQDEIDAASSFDPISEEPDGIHSSYGGREDLSGVLQNAEEIDVDLDADSGAIAAIGVELDDGSDSIGALGLSADELDDVSEIGISMDDLDATPSSAPVQEEPRRALLLYQEGTAEEQIYPFTGEILTVGRGRDNDIQIKNDSKVSRFHCKMFRRSANFYIEDNKSSNGTLVNGEIITERRLFGGEEIVIGETYFRFRIM